MKIRAAVAFGIVLALLSPLVLLATSASSSATDAAVPMTNQAPLTVGPTTVVDVPLVSLDVLTTTGGSGTGAVLYTATAGTTSCHIAFTNYLSADSPGTCIVTATKGGDATYNAVSSAPTTITVVAAPPGTVTLPPLTDTMQDQAPLTIFSPTTSIPWSTGSFIGLTTSGGSGTGYVSYTVTDGTASGCNVWQLDEAPVVESTSPGTCIVAATKAADVNYHGILSPPVTFTFAPPAPTPPAPTPTPPPIVTSPTTTPNHGYWLVGSDGGIFSFGSAQFYGSTGSLKLQRPVVGITPTANDAGYWLVASDGGIFSFGNAQYYGSIPGLGFAPAGSSSAKRLNAPIVGMVPSADGGGYFMVGSDGGVFTFGDAKFEGSCPGIGGCSGAAVAVMPDATGNGYWLVTTTGHVYAFGDAAPNYGAPGPQNAAVTSAVRTTDGGGYWILFANGVVGAYGDAANLGGPTESVSSLNPATTIFTTSDGGGYWVASANGSVFTYGDAPYEGGMAGVHLNGSIIAATGW